MDAAALHAFNDERIRASRALFGSTPSGDTVIARYLDVDYPAIHTAIKSNKSLRDGGFTQAHDFVVIIGKDIMTARPAEETRITIVRGDTAVEYFISEVIDSYLRHEWRLGLRQII